jgi:tetratricopeptide (TPR) repeat protein
LLLLASSIARAQASKPPAFDQLAAKADTARDASRLDEAVPLYRKALALRPAWKEGWWSLGTILYDQNSYPAAARAFGKLVAIDPKNGTAHLMLALCQYQLNLNDRALTNIQAAKELGIRKEEQLERVLQFHEGMLLLRKGDYERSIDALKILVTQGVESEDLDAALGMAVLLMLPKAAPAEGSTERQIVLRAGRAEHFSLLQKNDEAKKAYANLVQEFPDFPNVHYAFGRFLLTIQDPESAVPQFQEEIKRNPTHIRARMQIAAVHYRVDSSAGIPFASEVVKLEPTYPFGHYLLGLLYFDSGDVQHAIPPLEAAARMAPREAQFQFALGNAYAKAGRKEDAARARAAFRNLGGATQSPNKPTTYGDQSPSLDHAAGPAPQSTERKQP